MTQASTADQGCDDFRLAARLDRRQLLQVGGLTGMGLLLPDLFRAQAGAAPVARGTFGRARSVIMLYLHGGHAQQETWDPKPDGPSPEKGEFGAVATSVPGVRISELLPRCARIMHRLAVIRSMRHGNANHVQASLSAMTGHAHPPSLESRGDFPPSPSDFPPFGAVLQSLRKPGRMPTWVQIGPQMRRSNGTVLHGQLPGFLGARYGPLTIDQALLGKAVRIGAVTPSPELSMSRLADRQKLLKHIDGQRRLMDDVAEVRTLDDHQQRAFRLLSSPAAGKAFDLSAESALVRERYGRTQFGQCCLLARRLAEAGVPMINVHYCQTPSGSWDTHGKHFTQMKQSLCPTFDQAFAAARGGPGRPGASRTDAGAGQRRVRPDAEDQPERRPRPLAVVYSIAMAGGGAGQGVVYGSSDKAAAYPRSHPHDPRDLAATVYHLMGVPADTIVHDQTARPHQLVLGQKIDGLLG